ncbi:hypothetical protein RNZ50_14260 [Paracoccaceae bacterium Fryx2]|nr:hypothetical protein [Paracoccaceae bacterium Fryx2]
MDYCTKWKILGLLIALTPFGLALLGGTAAARWGGGYWRAVLWAGLVAGTVLATLVPASLIVWNGLRPAICNRMN